MEEDGKPTQMGALRAQIPEKIQDWVISADKEKTTWGIFFFFGGKMDQETISIGRKHK